MKAAKKAGEKGMGVLKKGKSFVEGMRNKAGK